MGIRRMTADASSGTQQRKPVEIQRTCASKYQGNRLSDCPIWAVSGTGKKPPFFTWKEMNAKVHRYTPVNPYSLAVDTLVV